MALGFTPRSIAAVSCLTPAAAPPGLKKVAYIAYPDGTLPPGDLLPVATTWFWPGASTPGGLVPWAMIRYTLADAIPGDLLRVAAFPTAETAEPDQIAGLNLWLAADRITGVADSGAVSSWTDLSPAGNNATQGTGSAQPTYRTGANGLGGRPAVVFDGTGDWLAANGLATVFSGTDKPLSVIVVMDTTAYDDDPTCLWSAGNSGTTTPYQNLDFRTTPSYRVGKRDDGNTGADTAQGTPNTNPTIVSYVHTGVAVSLFANGATVINAAASNVGATTLNRFTLGAFGRTAAEDFYNGRIAEVCAYDAAISTANRQRLERYLARKYGITL